MLEAPTDLPPGALLDRAREGYAAERGAAEGFWWQADRAAFDLDEGVVRGWRDAIAGRVAVPTRPNEDAARLRPGAAPGLHTEAGVHCGLVAPGVTERPTRFTMGVIYSPPAEGSALTLLTLNASYHGEGGEKQTDYLFLSDGGDSYTVKDTAGAVDLTVPVTAPAQEPRLALVTLDGARLAFAENLGPAQLREGRQPDLGGAADLFFGVRSHRGGLRKTLGSAHLHEVFFWPRHTLLLPRGAEDAAQLAALRRYFLWGF